jgi:hypothetical protein
MGKGSASPGIDDCLALIGRADVHLNALERRLNRFLRSGAYSIDIRIDPQAPSIDDLIEPFGRNWRQGFAGPDRPIEMVLIGHVRRSPPSRDAGLLIADAVNNLRAALDNLIWLLSIKVHTRPADPIPKRSPWRRVGWPVVLHRSDWEDACSSQLQFVDPAILPEIAPFQPFSRREQDPQRDEFAVLNELWNIHKHRHLPLTEFWLGLDHVTSQLNRVTLISSPPHYGDDLRAALRSHAYEIVEDHPRGRFEDGAVLGTVREARPPYSWWPDMHLHTYLAVDVAFGTDPPGYGAPVQETLSALRDQVAAVVRALGPYV